MEHADSKNHVIGVTGSPLVQVDRVEVNVGPQVQLAGEADELFGIIDTGVGGNTATKVLRRESRATSDFENIDIGSGRGRANRLPQPDPAGYPGRFVKIFPRIARRDSVEQCPIPRNEVSCIDIEVH